MGEKFKLRMFITEEELSKYELPIDPIYEMGVIFIGSKNVSKGGILHVEYEFVYFDEQGEKHVKSLEKSTYNYFFVKDLL